MAGLTLDRCEKNIINRIDHEFVYTTTDDPDWSTLVVAMETSVTSGLIVSGIGNSMINESQHWK